MFNKVNKIEILGHSNLVFQDADGKTTQVALETFLSQFTEEKDKRIRTLEELLQANKDLSSLQLNQHTDELRNIRKERDELKEKVKNLLEGFEGVNIDESSSYYKEAYQAFIHGEIDKAIGILQQREVDNDLELIYEEEKKVKSKLENLEKKKMKISEELVFRADLLSLSNKIGEAKAAYEKAIGIYATFTIVDKYVSFLYFHHDFKKAFTYALTALELAEDNDQKSWELSQLGMIEVNRNNFPEAKKYLIQALSIDKESKNLRNEARTQLHMGNLFMQLNLFNESLGCYLFCEKSYLALIEKEPANDGLVFSLALSKMNVSNIYQRQNDFKKAESYLLAALKLLAELLGRKVDVLFDYAKVFYNLANLYDAAQKYENAIDACNRAFEIYNEKAKADPSAYNIHIAKTLNCLGSVYQHQNNLKESIDTYNQALDLALSYENLSPETHRPLLGTIYNNLALSYELFGQNKLAEEKYLESVKRKADLVKIDPKAFEPDLALTLSNLGVLYERMELFDRALETDNASLEIYTRLANDDPKTYLEDAGRVLRNIGVVYEAVHDFKKATDFHSRSLEKYLQLESDYPKAFQGDIANVYFSLAVAYFNSQDLQKGLDHLKIAFQMFEVLYGENPKKYYSAFAHTLINYARVFLGYGEKEKALAFCQAAKSMLMRYRDLNIPWDLQLLGFIQTIESAAA